MTRRSIDSPLESRPDASLTDETFNKLVRLCSERSAHSHSLVGTTVAQIAILARRMGMHWIDFRPEDGIMSAEGNGLVVYSALVRSVGVVVHFRQLGSGSTHMIGESGCVDEGATGGTYIPNPSADMLGFGILPGVKRFGLPDYRIGSLEEVYLTLDALDPSGAAKKVVRDVRTIEPACTFGFSDLIPLATTMLRQRGSTITRVPIPTEYSVGLTCHKEGFVVYYHRLREHIASQAGCCVPDRRVWALDAYRALRDRFTEWEDEVEANRHCGKSRSLTFLETVHDLYDETTKYFEDLEDAKPGFRYRDLVAAHIKHAVRYWNDAWANMRGEEGRTRYEHYGLRDWIAEGAHMYWEYLPGVTEEVKRRCEVGDEVVREAWVVMMLRAFCWWRCHYMMPGQDMVKDNTQRVASRYWGCGMPVLVG